MVSHPTHCIPHSVSSAVAGVPLYPKVQQLSLSDIKKKSHHVVVLTASTGGDTTLGYKILLLYLEVH